MKDNSKKKVFTFVVWFKSFTRKGKSEFKRRRNKFIQKLQFCIQIQNFCIHFVFKVFVFKSFILYSKFCIQFCIHWEGLQFCTNHPILLISSAFGRVLVSGDKLFSKKP